jgi:hypothetical protein
LSGQVRSFRMSPDLACLNGLDDLQKGYGTTLPSNEGSAILTA